MLDTYIKWFQSHERILIIALVLGVSYVGYGKWLDKAAIDSVSKAAVAQQVAAVQHDADVKIAAAVAQQTALFNQESLAHEHEMAVLVAAVASRDAASNQQIAAVTQPKTLPQAVADLNAAYKLPTPLTVEEAGSIPTADIQSFTVAKIEADTAKADLENVQQELASAVYDGDQARNLIGSLTTQVSGLETELTTQATASKAEIAAVKAAARKSKFGWFKAGAVVGFVAGFLAGHYK
jgi:hypothetical protein